MKNYDLCIKSDDFGVEDTAKIIRELFQKMGVYYKNREAFASVCMFSIRAACKTEYNHNPAHIPHRLSIFLLTSFSHLSFEWPVVYEYVCNKRASVHAYGYFCFFPKTIALPVHLRPLTIAISIVIHTGNS